MSEELDFISDKVNISLKDSLQDYILKLGTELSESENTTLFLNGISLLELLDLD